MTRQQAQIVVQYIDVVKHFAEGGQLDYELINCDGKKVGTYPVTKDLHISGLPTYIKSNRAKETIQNKNCSCCFTEQEKLKLRKLLRKST